MYNPPPPSPTEITIQCYKKFAAQILYICRSEPNTVVEDLKDSSIVVHTYSFYVYTIFYEYVMECCHKGHMVLYVHAHKILRGETNLPLFVQD